MKLIPTQVHGILDYVIALLLIGCLWFFPMPIPGPVVLIPFFSGLLLLTISVCTIYEVGVIDCIPMPAHLLLDALLGILLALSPWIFDFSEKMFLPHISAGLLLLLAALFTEWIPRKHRF